MASRAGNRRRCFRTRRPLCRRYRRRECVITRAAAVEDLIAGDSELTTAVVVFIDRSILGTISTEAAMREADALGLAKTKEGGGKADIMVLNLGGVCACVRVCGWCET